MSGLDKSPGISKRDKVSLGGMTAIAAALISFIVLLLIGPFFEDTEAWEGFGILWWFSLAAIALFSFLSPFVFGWYRNPKGSIRWGLLFLAVASGVAILGILTTYLIMLIIL